MKRSYFVFLTLVSVAVLIVGCQPRGSGAATSPAIEALVAYLSALTDKDEAALTVLSCTDWEANALLELDAFQSVETRLEGLNCQQNVTDGSSVTVTCQGKIVTSYGGEVQEFDLGKRTYSMVEQDGNWLVCGY
ncbi:MAG: hypothetical protein M1347_04445 [Chloroflexi bacterium]|nr:hypothetical protein [Chloroflexota bacterium]